MNFFSDLLVSAGTLNHSYSLEHRVLLNFDAVMLADVYIDPDNMPIPSQKFKHRCIKYERAPVRDARLDD